MGSKVSSESITLTVDQLDALLRDLKANDAKVTIHVSAFHYEQNTETAIENVEIPPEEEPNGGRSAAPAPPRFRQKVQTEVKEKKVETFQTEHHIPLSYCLDLTGPTLEGWKPTVKQPVVIVKLKLEVSSLDRESSEQLGQHKRHLESKYANKDKVLETKVKFTIKGKTLVAGKDPITITAYDPNLVDEANSGCCCFGRPGVKRAKVTVTKKFFLFSSSTISGQIPPAAILCTNIPVSSNAPILSGTPISPPPSSDTSGSKP